MAQAAASDEKTPPTSPPVSLRVDGSLSPVALPHDAASAIVDVASLEKRRATDALRRWSSGEVVLDNIPFPATVLEAGLCTAVCIVKALMVGTLSWQQKTCQPAWLIAPTPSGDWHFAVWIQQRANHFLFGRVRNAGNTIGLTCTASMQTNLLNDVERLRQILDPETVTLKHILNVFRTMSMREAESQPLESDSKLGAAYLEPILHWSHPTYHLPVTPLAHITEHVGWLDWLYARVAKGNTVVLYHDWWCWSATASESTATVPLMLAVQMTPAGMSVRMMVMHDDPRRSAYLQGFLAGKLDNDKCDSEAFITNVGTWIKAAVSSHVRDPAPPPIPPPPATPPTEPRAAGPSVVASRKRRSVAFTDAVSVVSIEARGQPPVASAAVAAGGSSTQVTEGDATESSTKRQKVEAESTTPPTYAGEGGAAAASPTTPPPMVIRREGSLSPDHPTSPSPTLDEPRATFHSRASLWIRSDDSEPHPRLSYETYLDVFRCPGWRSCLMVKFYDVWSAIGMSANTPPKEDIYIASPSGHRGRTPHVVAARVHHPDHYDPCEHLLVSGSHLIGFANLHTKQPWAAGLRKFGFAIDKYARAQAAPVRSPTL